MAELIGASIGGVLGFVWLLGFVLLGTMPVLAFVVTLNIRRIRMQLERIANTLEATPGYTRTSALNLHAVSEPSSRVATAR